MSDVSLYLKNIYPFPLILRMLAMGTKEGRYYRDLAFTFNHSKFWWRDKDHSIVDAESFAKAILQRNPGQIHFDQLHVMNDEGGHSFYKREIVFDLDLTDFTRYCHCDKKTTSVCTVCWLHVEGASRILREILVHRLGVEEECLLWVFSGMKGIHCIVNDSRFTQMSQAQLSNLYQFFYKKSVRDMKLFAETLRLEFITELYKHFLERGIRKRGYTSLLEFEKSALTIIRREYYALYDTLSMEWKNMKNAEDKWNVLLRLEANQGFQPLPSLLLIIMVYYPIIDKGPFGVGKNHLFKIPFSIHKKTGHIALPMKCDALSNDHLPLQSLTLGNIVEYYNNNTQSIHPLFIESCLLFEKWLNKL